MDEKLLQVFIDGVRYYFEHQTEEPAQVGTPYLGEVGQTVAYDYTGIIGVSGSRKGCVYYSAPRLLLRYLLLSMGEKDADGANLADLAGEIANTISGNARREFGSDFMISVPVVVSGETPQIQMGSRGRPFYVIPVTWHQYPSALVVSLE